MSITSGQKYPCYCCGYLTLPEPGGGSYEVCEVCFWQDDWVDNQDADVLGPNKVTLTEARQNFRVIGASEARDLPFVRPPLPDEVPPALQI
jgi:hypothetical protein